MLSLILSFKNYSHCFFLCSHTVMLEILIVLACLTTVRPDPLPYAEWAHYHMVWLPDSQRRVILTLQSAVSCTDK